MSGRDTIPATRAQGDHSERVDVIVPAYRGSDALRRCLASVRSAEQQTPFELVLVDDRSPEPEVAAFLHEVATDTPGATLLRNEENQGFVGSVNRGMSLHPDRDVVILNSDTEVANDWLDRLVACAYRADRIGTVTPFSNNATICSYPRFCEVNPIPDGWSTSELDRLFREVNKGASVELPTAVGFCMLIRRACLKETGLFDVERFGKGYGEENDFSVRAARRGWKNVLCADAFVYHEGNVSFGQAHSAAKERGLNIVRRLHRDYERSVFRHIAQDPARALRLLADIGRLRRGKRTVVLFVTHDRSGGTEKHIRELASHLGSTLEPLIMHPGREGHIELRSMREGEPLRLFFRLGRDLQDLVTVLQAAGVTRLHFHHLLGHADVVRTLPARLEVPYDFTFHDYHVVCPNISMTAGDGRYCGAPGEATCDACITRTGPMSVGSIREWRDRFREFVTEAERLFVPSRDAADRVSRYFPDTPVIVAPHTCLQGSVRDPAPRPTRLSETEPLRIAVLGALSAIKGADVLEGCALAARRGGLPLEFHLIGYAYRSLKAAPRTNLSVHGEYTTGQLRTIFDRIRPHVVWFPAQWPETFSYTLSEALEAGLPVLAPELGAFPERLRGRPWTWVRPWKLSPEEWNREFLAVRRAITEQRPPLPPEGELSGDVFDYTRSYLGTAAAGPQAPAVDWATLRELLASHADIPRHTGYYVLDVAKRTALQGVTRARSLPLFRTFVRRIPATWQTRVKNWLLGHTAH